MKQKRLLFGEPGIHLRISPAASLELVKRGQLRAARMKFCRYFTTWMETT